MTTTVNKDVERVLFTAEELAQRVHEMGDAITRDYAAALGDSGRLLVVGILKGASVFTVDLIRQIILPVELDFIVTTSYGSGSETSGTVTVHKDIAADIAGRHVLICEDIIDSGVTLSELMPRLAQRGPASLKLCALLSKPSRRVKPVHIDYCGWEVPDEFIVGYGLDYAERYRNLPCIGILKREVYGGRA